MHDKKPHNEEDITLAKKKKDYGTGIPDHEIEAIAECLLPSIQAFFESEEGQREFEEWKKQQAKKQSVKRQKKIGKTSMQVRRHSQ